MQSSSLLFKSIVDGTHRLVPAHETLRRIRPLARSAGVTRLADVTRLDTLGLPVWQAHRPRSRVLTVSQGKGINDELAQVSALMESLEQWHAERVVADVPNTSIQQLSGLLAYDPFVLPRYPNAVITKETPLDWLNCRAVLSARKDLVPLSLVSLDFRYRASWTPPLFHGNTSGLASGNCLEEALLHGLLEVVERHCHAQAQRSKQEPVLVSTSHLTANAGRIAERVIRAGATLRITDIAGQIDLPCYMAEIWSSDFPVWVQGFGCHLDSDVALCRAITESAQGRLTHISGARDDMASDGWDRLERSIFDTPPQVATAASHLRDRHSRASALLSEDVRVVAELIISLTGTEPLYVDLTSPEMQLPVVRIVAPGLDLPRNHG